MKTKLIINFPANRAQEPVIYNLVTVYGLKLNILRANIDMNLAGHLLAEIEGPSQSLAKAIEALNEKGIDADFVNSTISIDEATCVECGLCTAVCGTKALRLDAAGPADLTFEENRCVGCNLCVQTCPLGAIRNEVGFSDQYV